MAKAMAKARSWTRSQGKHKARQTKGAGKKKKGTGKDAAKGSGKTGKSVKLGQAAFVANKKVKTAKSNGTTNYAQNLEVVYGQQQSKAPTGIEVVYGQQQSKLSTDSSSLLFLFQPKRLHEGDRMCLFP